MRFTTSSNSPKRLVASSAHRSARWAKTALSWLKPSSTIFTCSFLTQPTPALSYAVRRARSEEHTSELQSLMRISYAVFCLKKKNQQNVHQLCKTTLQEINKIHIK